MITLSGTIFLADVSKNELRQLDDPDNRISIFEMHDIGTGYAFEYDARSKNIADAFSESTSHTEIVLPQLVNLDPEGIAEKYGYHPEEIKGKTDFEVMVNQAALEQRLNGRLITIDIDGHVFYVDIRMGMLRPKDDFSAKGIIFDEVSHYLDNEGTAYQIPYNTQRHSFQEIDYEKVTEIPKDLLAIEFPHQRFLDPVGYNRKHGWELKACLKETGIHSHFTAKTLDWKDTRIHEVIADNLKKQRESMTKVPSIRRGRRM